MNRRTRRGVNWWLACGVVVGGVVILGVLAGIYYWFIPASGPVPSVQILQPTQAIEIESGQAVVVVARGESSDVIQRIDFFVDDIPVNQQLSGQPQQASLEAVFPWYSNQLGIHKLSVISYNDRGNPSQPDSVLVVVKAKEMGAISQVSLPGSPAEGDGTSQDSGGQSSGSGGSSGTGQDQGSLDEILQNVDENGDFPLNLFNQPGDVPPVVSIFYVRVGRDGGQVVSSYSLAAVDDVGLAYVTFFIASSTDPFNPFNSNRIACGGELSCAASDNLPMPQGSWILSVQATDTSGQVSPVRAFQVDVAEGQEPHAFAFGDEDEVIQLDPNVNWEEVQSVEDEGEDDIGVPEISEYLCGETYETVALTVPYIYMSDHGDEVYVGAFAESGNIMVAAGHTTVQRGAGVVRFEMEQLVDESINTDQLELHFMATGGDYFYKEMADFPITWPTPKPDLQISFAGYRDGQWQVDVENIGCTLVDGFDLQLQTLDGGVVNERITTQISPGRSYTWTSHADLNLLSQGFKVVVDPNNTVDEGNEDNNFYEKGQITLQQVHIYQIDIHNTSESEWTEDDDEGEFYIYFTVNDLQARRPKSDDWLWVLPKGSWNIGGYVQPVILSPHLNWNDDLFIQARVLEDDDLDMNDIACWIETTQSYDLLIERNWKTGGEFSATDPGKCTIYWRVDVSQ